MVTEEKVLIVIDGILKRLIKTEKDKIVLENYLNGEILDFSGKILGLSRERVRQILSAITRRAKTYEERVLECLKRYTFYFSFEKRYVNIENSAILDKLKIIIKISTSKYIILNNYIVDKYWWLQKEAALLRKYEKENYLVIPEIWTRTSKYYYDGVIFKNIAGICRYWLLTNKSRILDLNNTEVQNYIENVTGVFSERNVFSILERQSNFNKCSKTIYKLSNGEEEIIANKIRDIVNSWEGNILGKDIFKSLIKEVCDEHSLLDNEGYFIFKKYHKDAFVFSSGNRMIIQKNGSLLSIKKILQKNYGDGPSLIKIKIAQNKHGFSKHVLTNGNNDIYNFNPVTYLYFSNNIYSTLRKDIIEIINYFPVSTIKLSRIKNKLKEKYHNTKMSFIVESIAFLSIFKKTLSNDFQYEIKTLENGVYLLKN